MSDFWLLSWPGTTGTGGGQTIQPVQGWRQSLEGYGLQTLTHTAMRCICTSGTQLVFSRDVDMMIRYCDVMYLYEEDAVGYSSNIDKTIR